MHSGGPDGELGASLRYLSQRYAMPYPAVQALLTDIGTEELGHLEMIAAIVHQLTRNLTDDQIQILLSPRSSISSLQDDVKDRIATLAEVLGFDVIFEYEYPGWSYVEHSPVREVFQESYRDLFGTDLKIESIHAGLECGLFADALDGLDTIAVGPQLHDVHTPDEHMDLASFENFYTLLVDVLRRMAA